MSRGLSLRAVLLPFRQPPTRPLPTTEFRKPSHSGGPPYEGGNPSVAVLWENCPTRTSRLLGIYVRKCRVCGSGTPGVVQAFSVVDSTARTDTGRENRCRETMVTITDKLFGVPDATSYHLGLRACRIHWIGPINHHHHPRLHSPLRNHREHPPSGRIFLRR